MRKLVYLFLIALMIVFVVCKKNAEDTENNNLIGVYVSASNELSIIEICSEDEILFKNVNTEKLKASYFEQGIDINLDEVFSNQLKYDFIDDVIFVQLTDEFAAKIAYTDDNTIVFLDETFIKKEVN